MRDLKVMMMKSYKIALLVLVTVVMFQACKKDDNGSLEPFVPRDRQEVQDSSALNIQTYLETHFYNYEEFENPPADFDYIVRFDEITGENSDKTPLIDQVVTEQKTVGDVDYDLFILEVRKGEGQPVTFADSAFLSYRTGVIGGDLIDYAPNPLWLPLSGTIRGFSNSVDNVRAATSISQNSDGTITASNDYGIGAVFIPAGLGYYNTVQSSTYIYTDLYITFRVFGVNGDIDSDGDGVIDFLEDVNGNQTINDDDTDGDGIADVVDTDDDGDGILTIDEINIAEDGTVTYPDTDNDGTPDYLDPDN